MKLYSTPKGTWCGTQADWFAAMKAEGAMGTPEDHTVNVPTTKPELMEFLTFHGLNVIQPCGTTVLGAVVSQVTMTEPSYAEKSVALDDLFQAAPLGQRLTLAAIAIEDARMLVPMIKIERADLEEV